MQKLAAELQAAISEHRPRQQTRLEQHLKAVADSEHRSAGRRKLRDLLHDRREARDGAGPQVISVSESSGKNDGVGAAEAGVLVPDEFSVLTEHVPRNVIRVVVAIRSREDNNSKLHDATSMR